MRYTRTQVYLDPQQHRALREEARARGISLAEMVRQIVAQYLQGKAPPAGRGADVYKKIIGLGSSGRGDVSERHDAYLAEAFRDDHSR